MRRLPSHLLPAAAELIRWAEASGAPQLAPDMVPGAQAEELGKLAALGALARALAPNAVETWPESVASWARDSPVEVPLPLLSRIIESLQSEDEDILASVYEHLVSGVNRRRLGTFFTPPAIVNHMMDICQRLIPRPDHVVDPGAGVGAFSLEALRIWPSAKVTAVDLNVVTLGLLAARIDRDGTAKTGKPKLNLVAENYLTWMQEAWPCLDGVRLVVGNPPYTRNQHMTRKEKKEAQQAAGGFITSGLAGLSAYFMAATIRALRPQDAMCLLLPGSWCETRYGRELREWIWGARNRRIELHVFPSEVAVFPGTQVTAMILVVGPEKSRRQEFVVRDVNLDTAGAGQVISRRVLTYDRTVQCPSTFSELLRTKSKTVGAQIALGEIAKVRRGVATGASDFFFVTDSTRIEFDLPLQVLREALVKPAHCSSLSFTRARHDFLKREGLPCWLLDLNGNSELCEEENIARYLHEGILRGAHNTHLAQQRKSWHTVELVSAPDIFIAPVGKREHRVILNSIKAVGSNNLYGLYLSRDTLWKPFYLAAWFRSEAGQAALQDVARQYQGGSLKIEPRALRSLSIPATPP